MAATRRLHGGHTLRQSHGGAARTGTAAGFGPRCRKAAGTGTHQGGDRAAAGAGGGIGAWGSAHGSEEYRSQARAVPRRFHGGSTAVTRHLQRGVPLGERRYEPLHPLLVHPAHLPLPAAPHGASPAVVRTQQAERSCALAAGGRCGGSRARVRVLAAQRSRLYGHVCAVTRRPRTALARRRRRGAPTWHVRDDWHVHEVDARRLHGGYMAVTPGTSATVGTCTRWTPGTSAAS